MAAARPESLDFHLQNEDKLVARAMGRPVFGKPGLDRSLGRDDHGLDVGVIDGMEYRAAAGRPCRADGSMRGGAAASRSVLPAFPARTVARPGPHCAAVFAVLVALFMIDCLLNAMINPVYLLAAGGLAGFTGGATDPAPGQVAGAASPNRGEKVRPPAAAQRVSQAVGGRGRRGAGAAGPFIAWERFGNPREEVVYLRTAASRRHNHVPASLTVAGRRQAGSRESAS